MTILSDILDRLKTEFALKPVISSILSVDKANKQGDSYRSDYVVMCEVSTKVVSFGVITVGSNKTYVQEYRQDSYSWYTYPDGYLVEDIDINSTLNAHIKRLEWKEEAMKEIGETEL